MKNKLTTAIITLTIMIGLFTAAVKFAVIPIREAAVNEKKQIYSEIKKSNLIEGSILDRYDQMICCSTEMNTPSSSVYQAYNSLIGYESKIYGASGLRQKYSDELWTKSNADKTHGKNLKLTTSNELQCICYDLIKGYDASVVVEKAESGEILALASTNSKEEFEVNDITQEKWELYNNIDGYFVPNWKTSLAPGSVFKMLTSCLIVEHNWQDDVYNDTGTEQDIHNYGHSVYGNVTLREGAINSVNTYYSFMGSKLGAYNLMEITSRFSIGDDMETDFGVISSNNGFTDVTDENARVGAFGQGKLLLTSVNMCMVGQALSQGKLMQPYIVASVDGKKFSEPKILNNEVISSDTKQIIDDVFSDVADAYGIPSEYNVKAKTGTAQLPNGLNRASIIAYNDDYSVVISINNTGNTGSFLVPLITKIFDSLANIDKI